MSSKQLTGLTIIAGFLLWAGGQKRDLGGQEIIDALNKAQTPAVPDVKRPHRDIGEITTGGAKAPDGTEVDCDLPLSIRSQNSSGRDGSGLCVFTSITMAARWQNEIRLLNFQHQMERENGGGYPEKVDAMIKKYGPGAQYVQYEGDDPEILKRAIASGRVPCVTYNGHDVHYSGTIAHMVCLVHLDDKWACILDNNYIGANQLVWMTPEEFYKRWRGDGGWAVVLLSPPPPPPPRN